MPQPLIAWAQTVDFGDLPTAAQSGFASDYATTSATGGASHNVAAILRIGAQIDGESDGQPSAGADGDDANGVPDDEDGVQLKTPLRPSFKSIISIGLQQPLNSSAYVNGWIDFNQDGDFTDPGEQIASDNLVNNNAVRTDASNETIDFDIPPNAMIGFTYARFRYCSTPGGCNTPSGAAADGEVEDYRVEILAVSQLGDYVWLDSNGDGIQQSGEPGIEGVFVKLYRASDNALLGVTATDAAGFYTFNGLLPDTYYVEFVAPPGYSFTTALQGGNVANDSDADSSTGRTGNIVLTGGANNQDVDAGLVSPTDHLTFCEAIPLQVTELNHTFSLPKFDPAFGTLTGITINSYIGLQQWIGIENRAVNSQNARIVTSSDGFLTLPDNNFLNSSVGLDTGIKTYALYDGITDLSGASSFSYSDWQYKLGTISTNYATLADFIAASSGETVDLPFATLSGVSTTGGGGNLAAVQKTYASAGVCVDYSYEPVITGTITIVKNTVGGDATFTFSSSDADLNAVSLTTSAGTATSSSITKDAGSYIITEDALTDWKLDSITINGDTDIGSVIDEANRQATIDLDASENITVTFTNVERTVSIGSFVWEDSNANGAQDTGEPAIEGATVTLLVDDGAGNFIPAIDANGAPVSSQTTLADGLYFFDNLPEGDYKVQVTPPAGMGYLPSPVQNTANDDNAENDSNIASEPTPGTFESGVFTLRIDGEPTEAGTAAGDTQDDASDANGNMTVDFGFYKPVSIGSYVWQDSNADGIQDGGELAIQGATVSLLVDDGSGNFSAATDVTGAAVTAQTTGPGGLYFFDNLPAGTYKVQVTPPAGYLASPVQNPADDDDTEDDSNIAAESTPGTYESGAFTLLGGNEPAESDTQAGDAQDAAAIAPDASGNMTVDFGFVPPMSIGNRIWLDADVDGTDNGGTEPGVGGVTVTLYAADDLSTPLDTQVTNPEGFYRFDNLTAGDYVVAILADQFDDAADPLYGLVSTVDSGAGPDQNDNGAGTDPSAGLFSAPVSLVVDSAPSAEPSAPGGANAETLAAGDVATDVNYDATVDFGFTSLSLGNRVWLDLNGDGIDNDANNAPPGPVTVNLYDAADPNTIISTTTTTAAGYYRFDHLLPGNYIVEIPAAEFQTGGDLESWWSTITGGAENVDLNDNGINPALAANTRVAGIRSGSVALGVASEPEDDGSADIEDVDAARNGDRAPDINYDATVDFGFVQMSLGNRLWEDTNFVGTDDGTEPGFAGVVINLLAADGVTPVTDASGAPITTVTNAEGYYRFDGLPPGDYVVQIPASEFGAVNR
ncbi:MAG: choice-of-anchor E domain-containing protein [Caldilineaceae bacterium]|nr:choice-of-anchor E domain-containing protein [Caldilineaceae bacterium]